MVPVLHRGDRTTDRPHSDHIRGLSAVRIGPYRAVSSGAVLSSGCRAVATVVRVPDGGWSAADRNHRLRMMRPTIQQGQPARNEVFLCLPHAVAVDTLNFSVGG